jgi:Holliday junction DNA helicase RuvB
MDREQPFPGGEDDRNLDFALRPESFAEFVGQRPVLENLEVFIEAARNRDEPVDHILLSGMPGLGKTTLAHLVAHELGTTLRSTSGPALERPGDLAGILTNMRRGEILFIDEIHRLHRTIEEYLYSAMEDFHLHIVIDQGPSARSVRLNLEPFTIVGATTREGLLSSPLRSRFGVLERLEPYPWEDLREILKRSARLLKVVLDEDAAEVVARRSRGTPRIANRFLRRVRDFAEVSGEARVTSALAAAALTRLGIDRNGLGALDRKLLEFLVRQGGGPVGLKTIAIAVGEEPGTLEEVYEPHLIREGYLAKTPRGRAATRQAYAVLGLVAPPETAAPDAPGGGAGSGRGAGAPSCTDRLF